MKLYIDYTSNGDVKYAANVKYHGGGYYTRFIIGEILKEIERKKYDVEIAILWTKGYKPEVEGEREIYQHKRIEIIEVDSLEEFDGYQGDSILFIPLPDYYGIYKIKKIKKLNKGLRVYVTIHGLRFLDLSEQVYSYGRYFERDMKRIFYPILCIKRKLQSHLYRRNIKIGLEYADKVFTVSNYSMQQISDIICPAYLNFYYNAVEFNMTEHFISGKYSEPFVLFVSGNRPEKNFIRAAEAFCQFKRNTDNNLYLYVTGINEKERERYLPAECIDKIISDKWIRFLGYVSKEEIENLYAGSRFMLYTSISEGFGLPLLQSALYGRPVVASCLTAIPEVLGAGALYVDPHSTESITRGLLKMNEEKTLQKYEQRLESLRTGLLLRSEEHLSMLLADILS